MADKNLAAAIDQGDPINKGVFDNTLKKYINSRRYLVNSIYSLEPISRDSGGWSSNSYPNPTNYHVIENFVHISKGDKFSILIFAITIDTDNPENFYFFDIKIKLVYMNGNKNEEIHTGVITNSNSRKLLYNNWNHIQLNNIKKIDYIADDDLLSVQIDIKETILTS